MIKDAGIHHNDSKVISNSVGIANDIEINGATYYYGGAARIGGQGYKYRATYFANGDTRKIYHVYWDFEEFVKNGADLDWSKPKEVEPRIPTESRVKDFKRAIAGEEPWNVKMTIRGEELTILTRPRLSGVSQGTTFTYTAWAIGADGMYYCLNYNMMDMLPYDKIELAEH